MAFRKAFEFFDFGYSSALMITLSTVVLAVTFVFLQVRKAVAW
jgi:multiple sugar transport system permease protein